MDTSFFFLFLCLLQTLPLSSSNTFDTLRGTSLSVENPNDILISANGEYSAGGFLSVSQLGIKHSALLYGSTNPQFPPLFGCQTEMVLLMEEVHSSQF